MPQRTWEPVGQKDLYAKDHQLLIEAASAPANWLDRLQTTPGVNKTEYLDPSQYLCKDSVLAYGTPAVSTPLPMAYKDPVQYSHITFRSQESYDTALYAISNEGLYLADPCYDWAWQKNQKVDWHPMGQEKTFETTHMLTVATNKGITSSLWQQQIKRLPSVLSVTLISVCEH